VAYTTVAALKLWVEGTDNRLLTMLHCDPSAIDAQVLVAIEVASAKMDGFFSRAGYATPLTLSSLPETAALVAQRCMALAVREMFVGLSGMPPPIVAEAGRADQWLNQLAGTIGFSPQGKLGRMFTTTDLAGVARVR
jgi:hypothetical protein